MFAVQQTKQTTMENQTSNIIDQITELNKDWAGATTMSELEQFAIAKSKFVQPGCQLRLNANPVSYILMNQRGTIYIGCNTGDAGELQMMFSNKPVLFIKNRDGNIIGKYQKLF